MIAVAYIVNSFRRGGLERCVARLVGGLDRRRFRPFVICLTKSGGAAEWIGRGDVPVYELQKRPGNDWRVVQRLAGLLRRERVDIVHSHNWGTLVETTLARQWAGTPVHVHAQRGMFHHGNQAAWWKQAVRRSATRWACRRADAVVAVADSVRDDLIERWGVPAAAIEVISNGVAVPEHDFSGEAAAGLRQSLGIPASATVIGSIGRLVPVKDYPTLIQAVSRLVPNAPDVHLVIVGDGPQKPRLKAMTEEYGVAGQVHLVGEQSNVGDWLGMMDIYVNCSVSEGMSQSILEAMAMGLSLVVTDVGENAALVGGGDGCGRVVLSARPDEMAAAIKQLLLPAVRVEYGERARERHRLQFDLAPMLASYEALYSRLVAPVPVRQSPRQQSLTAMRSRTTEPIVR